MNERDYKGQKGIILIPVLVVLTLFGIAGISFTFYAAKSVCVRNPTVEEIGERCTKTIGNTPDHRP
jgi:flagellar basal body-associated protein FliL